MVKPEIPQWPSPAHQRQQEPVAQPGPPQAMALSPCQLLQAGSPPPPCVSSSSGLPGTCTKRLLPWPHILAQSPQMPTWEWLSWGRTTPTRMPQDISGSLPQKDGPTEGNFIPRNTTVLVTGCLASGSQPQTSSLWVQRDQRNEWNVLGVKGLFPTLFPRWEVSH